MRNKLCMAPDCDCQPTYCGKPFMPKGQVAVKKCVIRKVLAEFERLVDIAGQVDSWESFPNEPINRALGAIELLQEALDE